VNKVALGQIRGLWWTKWHWGRCGICGEQSSTGSDMGFVANEVVLGQFFFLQVLRFYSQLSHIQCSIFTFTCRWCFIVYILTVLLQKPQRDLWYNIRISNVLWLTTCFGLVYAIVGGFPHYLVHRSPDYALSWAKAVRPILPRPNSLV